MRWANPQRRTTRSRLEKSDACFATRDRRFLTASPAMAARDSRSSSDEAEDVEFAGAADESPMPERELAGHLRVGNK